MTWLTTTGTGSAVDLLGYEGDVAVIIDAEAGAGVTYAVKLTESDTSGDLHRRDRWRIHHCHR
jgi:hypothetical protein